jgi:hypothetical protein
MDSRDRARVERSFENGGHSLQLTLDDAGQFPPSPDASISKTISDPDVARKAKRRRS